MDTDRKRKILDLKLTKKKGFCGCKNGGGANSQGYCSSDGLFACGCAHFLP